MLFDFDESQYGLRDGVRSILTGEWNASRLRSAWTQEGPNRDVWSKLAEVGLFGLLTPVEHGGFGGCAIDIALPLEEVGHSGLPGPVAQTAAVAAPILARYGSDHLKTLWLPGIASGQSQVALALHGHRWVLHAAVADLFLVESGDDLHLVPREFAVIQQLPSLDPTLQLGQCNFALSEATRLATGARAIEEARARDRTAVSALLVGLSQRMLEMTREHVLTRRQFGRPIGSFQAVKHQLADATVAIEAARGLSWYAAYAADRYAEGFSIASATAKGSASDAAHIAGRVALQCHGGIGFTWEADLHLWMQRAKALETVGGTTPEHRQALGAHVLGNRGR